MLHYPLQPYISKTRIRSINTVHISNLAQLRQFTTSDIIQQGSTWRFILSDFYSCVAVFFGIKNWSHAIGMGERVAVALLPPAEEIWHVRRGADKSLARPTSLFRWTESIMSFERGICSCAELQVFSCYRGWKEACQATRAISTTSRPELSSSFFFFARQSAEVNSHHPHINIWGTFTIVCHRQKLGDPV
jgi:hypothetical protein